MDYSTLIANKTTAGSIQNWVNKATVPSTTILSDAQAWIFQRLRVREMMATNDSFTFAQNTNSTPLPADFLDPVQFLPWGATDELHYVREEAFRAQRNSSGTLLTGTPSRWTVIGTSAYVDVTCSPAAFGGSLIYYALPAALGPSNTTNFLTNRFPTLLRHVCLAYSFEFLKDDQRMAAEFALAEQWLAKAQEADELWRRNQRRAAAATGISYATLVADKNLEGSIRNWANNPDIPAETILIEAQSFIYERLRVREMEKNATLTIAINTSTVSVPADFLDPIQFMPFASSAELPYVSERALAESTASNGTLTSGTPSRYTVVGTSVNVNVLASAAFSGRFTYFATPSSLATNNQTNFLTTRYPTLIRLTCLAFAFQHMGDAEKAAKYFADAEKAISEATLTNAQWRREQRKGHGGGAINYTTLIADKEAEGAIRNWVGNQDIPADLILTEAQTYLFERMRVREMMTEAAVTISSGQITVAVPAGFLDPIQFVPYGTTSELPYVDETALDESTDGFGNVSSGTPARWTIIGTNIKVNVKPTSNFSGRLTYYALPTYLSSGQTTSFLTTRYATALRLACIAFAFQHIGDYEKAKEIFANTDKAVAEANSGNELWRRNQREAHGGGAIDYTTLNGDIDLEGSIRNWVKNADVPADLILTEAQSWIYQRLRTREMMSDAAITVSSGQSSASLPADFLDPVQFLPYGQTNELPYVDETALEESTNSSGALTSGTPSRWTVVGTSIKVDVSASANFAGRFRYFASPAALSSINTTNFLTIRYPTTLRLVCTAFAYSHIGDAEKSAKYFADAEKSIAEANSTNELWRRNQRKAHSGGSLSYTTLTGDLSFEGSIRNWSKNADIPADLILTEAQAYIYERLRVREMMTDAAVSITIGNNTAAVPAGFLDVVQLLPYGATNELPYVSEAAIAESTNSSGVIQSGTPSRYTIVGTNIKADVKANSTFTGRLTYYATPTALAAGNTTNFLTTRYPTVLRFACLAFSYQHIGDSEKAVKFFADADKSIAEANASNELWRRNQRKARIDNTSVTYSQLVADKEDAGSIRNLLGKSDLPVDLILIEAQAWIYQRLRTHEMISVNASWGFAQNSNSQSLPADFLDPISFVPWGWGDPLMYVSEDSLIPSTDSNGTMFSGSPSYWSILGTNALVDVECDDVFNGTLTYYAKPSPLSSVNQNNFLTDRYPTLLRHALMAKGFEHMSAQDPKMQDKAIIYMKYAEGALVEAAATNDLVRRGQTVMYR